MAQDVRAAVQWLSARPSVRPGAIGIVGASLGANLALLAAVDLPLVRAWRWCRRPSTIAALRVDTALMKKLGDAPLWLAASAEDPSGAAHAPRARARSHRGPASNSVSARPATARRC